MAVAVTVSLKRIVSIVSTGIRESRFAAGIDEDLPLVVFCFRNGSSTL